MDKRLCVVNAHQQGWTVLQEINEYVRSHLPHKILIAEDLKGEDAINSVMHYDSQVRSPRPL